MAGKTEQEPGSRKTPHQQLKSKLDRRNQARQKQQSKQKSRAQTVSIFSGQNGAPRHVAIVPASSDVDSVAAIRALNESVDASGGDGGDVARDGPSRVRIDRFRQNLLYMPGRYDLLSALDVCRLADFVVVVLSAEVEVDEEGELLLKSIESQGISNVIAVVQVCRRRRRRRNSIVNRLLTKSILGSRQSQPSKEAASSSKFSSILRQSLLPVCGEGSFSRLQTRILQCRPVCLHGKS